MTTISVDYDEVEKEANRVRPYLVYDKSLDKITEFESSVFVLTMGEKPIGVYSTPEIAEGKKNEFIDKLSIRHKNIEFLFEIKPFKLDMPVDIMQIRTN
jgi:hypothetical protein